MDAGELKKLRQYYQSFLGIQRIFNNASGTNVRGISLGPLGAEINRLFDEFPDLIPFQRSTFSRDGTYSRAGICSIIAMVVARLQVVTEETMNTPIAEKRQFTFIRDLSLRAIVERDYSEIQKAYSLQCWKSVIILCGGTIEAVLTDLLLANETSAKSAKSSPKTTDITRWDFSNLIDVSVELKLLSQGVEKLSHSIREYRNLVHPGNEVRNKLKFDAEEAKIAFEVLNIVHRDLSH